MAVSVGFLVDEDAEVLCRRHSGVTSLSHLLAPCDGIKLIRLSHAVISSAHDLKQSHPGMPPEACLVDSLFISFRIPFHSSINVFALASRVPTPSWAAEV